MNPAHQVYWKELRQWLYPAGRLSRQFIVHLAPAFLVLALLGIFATRMEGAVFPPFFLPLAAAMGGASLGTALALDAFAGERERHTLETALATPIHPRELLWGKLLAQGTISAVGIVLLSGFWFGLYLFLAPDLLTRAVLLVTFPLILLVAAVFGIYFLLLVNLASLRSPTVKTAQVRFFTYMLLGTGLAFGPFVIGTLAAGFSLGWLGAPMEVTVVGAILAGGAAGGIGSLGYLIHVIRALVRETDAERFRIDL